ncbi:ABC transporter permease [Pelistega europaea]|uniref:ABC transporter permease n=1 Tax=Pelistega europaea TaxID=106147 RepID=A0A7Y4L7R3_9BURK|nr:ABC transporter permease [Pelistega europaea]NOL48550.1 ABC transporter permease [Pelistega europaea]
MKQYIVKRFLMMVLTILIIASLTFFLMHFIPGSPFDQDRSFNEAVEQNLRSFYRLDQPLYVQYLHYMQSIFTLDFGPSISHPDTTVVQFLERGFPVSFELGIFAVVVAVISGIALGVFAALKHNGVIDYLAMGFAVLGISIPNFILATLLIQEFAVNLGWFPAATWQTPMHMVLPIVALATSPLAIIARLTRASMLETLTQDYIRTAKAKGLSPWKVVVRHALRNALMPVVTLLGTLLASILTGTFIIEKIFAIPGMGRYFIDSISNRDYPVIMGTTVFYSTVLVVLLFLVDMVYCLLDPRIRLDKKGE